MNRKQIYFTDKHEEGLASWAKNDRKKFSEILREIVDKALSEKVSSVKKINLDNWKKFMGAGGGTGDRFMARDIDKILYVDPYK